MGAIICPKCQKLISSDEPRCPFCDMPRPGLWGLTTVFRRLGITSLDFPHLIVTVCVALYGLSLLLDPAAIFQPRSMFDFLSPSGQSTYQLGMTGTAPVFRDGRWWTLITAIYLHGSLLHIFFNMMWVRQLAPLVKDIFGPYRLFIIFTVSGVFGFVLSAFMGNYYTLGASGSIFGLLAAAIAYGRQMGSTLFTRQFLQWAVILFVFGFIFPGVDNWAHLGGFIGGYGSAYLFSRNFVQREGPANYIGAGLCILLTVAAFLLQLWSSLTVLF